MRQAAAPAAASGQAPCLTFPASPCRQASLDIRRKPENGQEPRNATGHGAGGSGDANGCNQQTPSICLSHLSNALATLKSMNDDWLPAPAIATRFSASGA